MSDFRDERRRSRKRRGAFVGRIVDRGMQTQGIPAKGHATVAFTIPASPALSGVGFFAQWVVLDGSPGGPPASVTRGLQVTIQ